MYRELFHFMRYSLHFRPTEAMVDFEKASRKAARLVWPGIDVKGCDFHMNQALHRKAKSFPLLNHELRHNARARFALKMIYRISLLPLNKVKSGRRAVRNYILRKFK